MGALEARQGRGTGALARHRPAPRQAQGCHPAAALKIKSKGTTSDSHKLSSSSAIARTSGFQPPPARFPRRSGDVRGAHVAVRQALLLRFQRACEEARVWSRTWRRVKFQEEARRRKRREQRRIREAAAAVAANPHPEAAVITPEVKSEHKVHADIRAPFPVTSGATYAISPESRDCACLAWARSAPEGTRARSPPPPSPNRAARAACAAPNAPGDPRRRRRRREGWREDFSPRRRSSPQVPAGVRRARGEKGTHGGAPRASKGRRRGRTRSRAVGRRRSVLPRTRVPLRPGHVHARRGVRR